MVTGEATFGGIRWCVIASDFSVIGGSMGAAVGERVVRAYRMAQAQRLPVLVVSASGGARMQEGMVALIQMARTAAAATDHQNAGLLQVAYLTSPTTGGVYASFASLADVRWAAPGATIGFAGPRVVEQTTGTALPAGAHTSESALRAGLVDAVVEPGAIATGLADLAPWLDAAAGRGGVAAAPEGRSDLPGTGSALAAPADPWRTIEEVRSPEWPHAGVARDRALHVRVALRSIDPAVHVALATTAAGRAVLAVTLERTSRPRPAGYRAARRAVALAARLGLPVVTFVDTPGADPSHDAEQDGIAGEIAALMAALATHPAPTVAVVTGEGGSGGALAFAACDRLLLLDGAVFSVIAPEGAAAILHRDAGRASEVAPLLKYTGPDLVGLGIVDAVVGSDALGATVDAALAQARAGDGRNRFDTATARWLVEPAP